MLLHLINENILDFLKWISYDISKDIIEEYLKSEV
jgi:hypothetical protein